MRGRRRITRRPIEVLKAYLMIIVETMGYADPIYRLRKIRTQAQMSALFAGSPVIHHDFHQPLNTAQARRDRRLWLDCRWTVTGRSEPAGQMGGWPLLLRVEKARHSRSRVVRQRPFCSNSTSGWSWLRAGESRVPRPDLPTFIMASLRHLGRAIKLKGSQHAGSASGRGCNRSLH
jgi:hypothetical protein